jgi:ribonuclease Z
VPRSRRQPSVLVRDWAGFNVLLDAGEGVQRSLFKAGVSPARVDVVAVTHPHGDHVNGLAGLLMTMSLEGRRKPLTLVSTPETLEFVRETLEATKTRLGFEVEAVEARGRGSLELRRGGGDTLTLHWFPVCHTVEAVGFLLEWRLRPRVSPERLGSLGLRPGPWVREVLERGEAVVAGVRVTLDMLSGEPPGALRIAYTGDTGHPCPSLEEAVRGVDVLIHEATLEAGLEGEASERGHSTALQAAEAAARAGAYLLVLVHVSGRYEGFEARRLLDGARKVFPNALLAWDGARLVVSAPLRRGS